VGIQQRRGSLAFGSSLLQYLIDLILAVHYNLFQTLYDTRSLQTAPYISARTWLQLQKNAIEILEF